MNSWHYFSMVFIKNSTVQAPIPRPVTILKRVAPQNRDGGRYAKPLIHVDCQTLETRNLTLIENTR